MPRPDDPETYYVRFATARVIRRMNMKIKIVKKEDYKFFVERWDEKTNKWKFWLPEDTYDFRDRTTFKNYYSSIDQATKAAKREKKKFEKYEKDNVKETILEI